MKSGQDEMRDEIREVVVRYYTRNLLRTIDTRETIEQVLNEFPRLGRIAFERMSDSERAEAGPTDDAGIVCVRHRCFVYARVGDELRRLKTMEEEIERTNP